MHQLAAPWIFAKVMWVSILGGAEHGGGIHLTQLVMDGDKIMILVNFNAFFSFLGGVPAEAPYGSIFLFTTAERQETHPVKRSKFWLQFSVATIFFEICFLGRGDAGTAFGVLY